MNNRISIFIVGILTMGMLVISHMDVTYFMKKMYLAFEIVALLALGIEYWHRNRKENKKQ